MKAFWQHMSTLQKVAPFILWLFNKDTSAEAQEEEV